MSMSIEAKMGGIAESVLLTSSPERVEQIARTLLENPVCYNRVRNMLGFTGDYQGKRVSVQGIGIGVASAAIYCSELAQSYGVKRMVCVDEGIAIQPGAKLPGLVLAQAAHTTSSMNRLLFDGRTFAGCADWELLNRAYDLAKAERISVEAGAALTLEVAGDGSMIPAYAKRGALCTDLASSAVYLCAGRFGTRALSMVVTAQGVSGAAADPTRREEMLGRAARLALALL